MSQSINALMRIQELAPYSPGLSIDEISERYGLARIIKLASNENPLGASPLAQEAIARNAGRAFRYPQGGNPRLTKALAKLHSVPDNQIIAGNGSDELIDLLIRILCEPGRDNIICHNPCFGIYPIQAAINGTECRRVPLKENFAFDFDSLIGLSDANTRLVFLTTPDNPTGYCPTAREVREFASRLKQKAPQALLVIDEAYMDFAPEDKCIHSGQSMPDNAAFLRTLSKSYGLAGLRIGYGVVPRQIADAFWSARLPFSINILAEEAALAALNDHAFREATLNAVAQGREQLTRGLEQLGCQVWPSSANFILFQLPDKSEARKCFEALLEKGIIIRPLGSYNLPRHLRVSIGTEEENAAFLKALAQYLE